MGRCSTRKRLTSRKGLTRLRKKERILQNIPAECFESDMAESSSSPSGDSSSEQDSHISQEHNYCSSPDSSSREDRSSPVPSTQNNKTVQRTLEFSPGGQADLFVHCQPVSIDQFTSDLDPPLPLESDSVNLFVDRVVSIVQCFNDREICSGYDDEKYEHVWSQCPFGKIDENPYRECSKLHVPIQRRVKAAAMDHRSKFTANKFLTEKQKMDKLAEQRRGIDLVTKKLKRAQAKIQELLQKQGFCLEESLSNDLMELLKNHKITPAQSVFLQQQVKASQLKNASGMRWHPTMVRFALSLYITSPAAYKTMRETGMVKLPSNRTLFNYSHAKPIEEGIDKAVLEKLADDVEKLCNEVNKITGKKETDKKYCVLMGDEMYISQNLVFQKSSGKLIGFTTLDNLDREVRMLEQQLDNCDKEFEETIATKIMVYMVKGVSSGIKKSYCNICCRQHVSCANEEMDMAVAKKKNNPLLAPYISENDERFQQLDNILLYLEEWESEAINPNCSIGLNATADNSNLVELEDSAIDEGGESVEEETHATRKILSKQTLTGIKMTTLAFKPMVTFLLAEGVTFINARVFSQDPLEQHFSKVRAGQGGSSNPNLHQSLKRTRDLDTIGDLGIKKRKGNSGECEDVVEVTTEMLPKLKCTHHPKFFNLTV
ncbi:Proteasome subunit beta [Frankliniella fusca]|uniref:Proteasome subunit beta n=1 Tax=Frankliniella fusca TaxID=407009 RepID=A0AAE1H4N9_9NEOP|nr:Proteasome subunit beta [Frankliniella fusca]